MAIGTSEAYTAALHTARLEIALEVDAGRLADASRKVPMVRLKVHTLMAERQITAYALSRGADLPYPTAYRLSRSGGRFGRLHADTLERLCRFFKVQPGRLLEWTPSNHK